MKKIFNNLLNGQAKTITSAAIILGAAGLVSRLLGAFRDRVLAGSFGAGDELDIYWAAFRIPDIVYNLLVIGALSAGFIPIFTSYFSKSENSKETNICDIKDPRNEGWHLANGILNILILGLIAICAILAIFAPVVMKIVTPGFSGEKLRLTISLTRFMLLSPIFLGVSAVLGGILQSTRRFFFFAIAPIMYNLGIIFGALVLVKIWGIYGLAAGVALGSFLHMVIQIPSAVSCGFRYRFVLGFKHEGILRITKLMVPRSLSLATSQITWLAMTVIASTLGSGSLSVLNFANNLHSFPLGIIGLSFAVAAFPTLSEWAAKKDWFKFKETLSLAVRQILFFIIPASALLIVLRAQIIRVILGTGKFDWGDTVATIEAFQYFCIGLFAQALIYLLIRAFFAIEDSKTPFFVGIFGSVIAVVMAFIFANSLKVAGISLALSIGSIFMALLLWFYLRRKIGPLGEKEIIFSTLKIILASFLAAVAAFITLRIMVFFVDTHTGLGIFVQGLAAGLVGLAIYVSIGLILRSSEAINFWQSLIHRLPWSRVAPEEEVISE